MFSDKDGSKHNSMRRKKKKKNHLRSKHHFREAAFPVGFVMFFTRCVLSACVFVLN